MEPLKLTTELRTDTGKGAARRLRAKGLIPGIFYGPSAAAVSVAVAPKALAQALGTPHRRNALLEIDNAGKPQLVMIKELQVHPVSRAVLHLDLYAVTLDQPVQANVPFMTEGRAKGVVAGGEINVIYRDLPVRTTPGNIPAVIKVDVTNMALGDFVRTKDLQLPAGVEVTLEPERNLISCAEPRKLLPEEEEGATPAEGKPATEGAPATPPAT